MRFSRSEKSVLNAVISNPPDFQERWYTREYVYSFVKPEMELKRFIATIHTLSDRKAIFWGDKHKTTFELTSIGLDYKERDHLEAKEKWKERLWSFLLGFISAALLELFVLWLTGNLRY